MFGGACSFFLTLFFTLFLGMQLYAWLFQPNYNEQLNRGFLPHKSNETYVMPTTDFLPAIAVFTLNLTAYAAGDLESAAGFSGAEYWDISWKQTTN